PLALPTRVRTRALEPLPACVQDEAGHALSAAWKLHISPRNNGFLACSTPAARHVLLSPGMEVQLMFDIPVGMGLPVDIIEVSSLYTSLSAVGLIWLAVSAVLLLVLLLAGRGIEPTDVVDGADAAEAESGTLDLPHAA